MTFSLLGSFLFQLKTLLLGETIRRLKFSLPNEKFVTFVQQKILRVSIVEAPVYLGEKQVI